MIRLALALALAAGGAAAQQGGAPAAALRGLDKFSGLTTDFSAPVGGVAGYARLTVRVLACEAAPDGGDAAYLEIVDGKDGAVAFAGWMFAGDPAVSALDHPRFDVWVLSCSTVSGAASPGSAPQSPASRSAASSSA